MPAGREGSNVSGSVPITAPAHSIYLESENQKHPLGSILVVGGGTFRYCVSTEALSPGKLCTARMDSDAEDTVTVAHPIGTTQVTITAASAITANQYAGGQLIVDEGTDAGHVYNIKSHPAIGSASTGVITLYEGIITAWVAANTDIVLVESMYAVQESNTDQIETPVCVPRIAVSSGYYFWGQTRGQTCVLQDEAAGNNTAERLLTVGSSTAGSVESMDASGEALVGMRLFDGADDEDAKYQPVMLLMD